MNRYLGVAFCCVLLLAASSPGENVSFTLDPLASTLTVSGTFAGTILGPQMPGSDVAGFTGIFKGERDGNGLMLETTHPRSLSQQTPQLPGSGPDSEGGSSFGLSGISPSLGPILVSFTPLQFFISSDFRDPLPSGSNGFAATDFGFFLADGALYYSVNGGQRSYVDLHGYGAPNQSLRRGTLTSDGTTETLLLPIQTTFSPYSVENVSLTFVGQFVAHRPVPEPGSAVLIAFGGGMYLVRRRRGVVTATE